MMISRIYHSLNLNHTDNGSDKVVYVLLPKQMEASDLEAVEASATAHGVNIILLSGFDWDACMTPWKATDIFKTSRCYDGAAKDFLDELINDYSFNIEHSMQIEKAERYLVGTSFSGLFAIWAATQKDFFKGVASLSGSFWYEDFQSWFDQQTTVYGEKFYLSLGEKEKDSKNKTLANVQESTEAVCAHLQELGKEVTFEMNPHHHFNKIPEKIDAALDCIIGKPQPQENCDEAASAPETTDK